MSLWHIVCAVLITTVWGTNFVVLRLGLDDFPPLMLIALRFALSAIPMVFFLRAPQTKIRWVILFGVAIGVLQFPLLMFGMSLGASPGLASVVMQTQVFFSVFFGIVLFGEKLTQRALLGLISAAIGVAMIASIHDQYMRPLAITFLLGGAISWAAGNVFAKRAGSVNMLSFIAWASLIPPIPLAVMSYFVDGWDVLNDSFMNLDLFGVAVLLWLAYPATLLAWMMWGGLIRSYSVSIVAPFSLLVPITGMISSALVFGETFTVFKLSAVGLIMLGLYLSTPRKSSAVPH